MTKQELSHSIDENSNFPEDHSDAVIGLQHDALYSARKKEIYRQDQVRLKNSVATPESLSSKR